MTADKKGIQVEFITPQGNQVCLEAKSVQVRTSLGNTEILLNHAPFFALLEPGTIRITPIENHKQSEFIYINDSGIIEVYKNQVVILADNGFFGKDLDEKALAQSESELRRKMNTSPERLAKTLKQLNEVKEKLRIVEEIRGNAKQTKH